MRDVETNFEYQMVIDFLNKLIWFWIVEKLVWETSQSELINLKLSSRPAELETIPITDSFLFSLFLWNFSHKN